MFHRNPDIPTSARIKQACFLIRYALFCPVWTVLWFVDELFFAEYKKQIIRPVFIIGQPRSGTTFLHRTLATDSDNFVALRHIDWRYPFICVQLALGKITWLHRMLNKNYWPDTPAGNAAAKMHPNRLSDWEEDGIFFEECFLHHFFIFLRFPYPHLLRYLDDYPGLPKKIQRKMLDMHRIAIQKRLYFCDKGHKEKFYLSKEVTSHNKIETILEIYPDAKFIVSVRESKGFMNSLLSLVRFSTASKNGINPIEIPGWERVFLDRMRKDSLLLKKLCTLIIKKDQQVRIMYSHFTRNLMFSLEYIYESIGLDISPTYRAYIEDMHRKQQKRDRGYEYEIKTFPGFEEFDRFVAQIDHEYCRETNISTGVKTEIFN